MGLISRVSSRTYRFTMHRLINATKRHVSQKALSKYTASTFLVSSPSEHVIQFDINRPDHKNSLTRVAWDDLQALMNRAAKDSEVRAIVLSATTDEQRPVFCAGIDVGDLAVSLMEAMQDSDDVARRFVNVRELVLNFQDKITAIESCRKPVIAAVSGAAVGLAIDILSACDIRYCDQTAWFTIKEVDVGLAADIGTLQRMGKVCGNDSTVRELALTARKFDAAEAKEIGFMSSIAEDRQQMMDRVHLVAKTIAEKSPVAVQGTKISMNYARDHSTQEGLNQIATWNGACLLSEDLMKSALAMRERKTPADIDCENL